MSLDQSQGNLQDAKGGNHVDTKTDSAQQSPDQYFCSRCDQMMPSAGQDQHNDWHFAKDLQAQETNQSQDPVASTLGRSSGPAATDPPPAASPLPPSYGSATVAASRTVPTRRHTNQVTFAADARARDEQQMQNALQMLQLQYGIYNSEIEPEHEAGYYCGCPIHNYQRMKWGRYGVQDMWSKAVLYPGEKSYNDDVRAIAIFSSNPYRFRVISPYGYQQSAWMVQQRPHPVYHASAIRQTIELNNALNHQAQAMIDAKEPTVNIWNDDAMDGPMSRLNIASPSDKRRLSKISDMKYPVEKQQTEGSDETPPNLSSSSADENGQRPGKPSRLSSFRKSMGMKSSGERAVARTDKVMANHRQLRDSILTEEQGRWPDDQWRQIVTNYQDKVGMTKKIADLRARQPIQYSHLLRAGYFEPIPVAWANQASNPLKFSIEGAAGWRGVTPAWRGFEDTAEERLYWVLNHRGGDAGMRLKPDFISALAMARARMARAVEPPPEYYSASDTCNVQHTSAGYSKQVMPAPFVAYDQPEVPTDDTMILLDVSGSMDFEPLRPNYDQYLITGYSRSTQPKNKNVAKAIIRRFTDAMANHDHDFRGYDLTTFSSNAHYIGSLNHKNLDAMWRQIRIEGGTRVMTGWQRVKELHFQKHSESATHHPVYGWQAGPVTPILRLLLLLDGEATDMDEFELDLLGLSWAHVTIFLIGVDGCPHHHRHANELQRISDVNHHVSFVDAQGNMPERFVTHELLKRHLGYELSMQEFEHLEELPAYSE